MLERVRRLRDAMARGDDADFEAAVWDLLDSVQSAADLLVAAADTPVDALSTEPAGRWDGLSGLLGPPAPLVDAEPDQAALDLGAVLAAAVARAQARRSGPVPLATLARLMTPLADLERLSSERAAAIAHRLGAVLPEAAPPGVRIAEELATGRPLYGSYEDLQIDVWGPRTGKTTTRAIPAVLDAPGAVLATSNKRDLVDATRTIRERRGPVRVFDPQDLIGEPPAWWWNPLDAAGDLVAARTLAQVFADGVRTANARRDAFFDPAGEELTACMLLAAAVSDSPIIRVRSWLSRPKDDTPLRILREAGEDRAAESLASALYAPEKQRLGIYGTAMTHTACLTGARAAAWVTPGGGRPRLDLDELLDAGGTLFSVSREGADPAGPLVTALTVAALETAERRAARAPLGRLATPLLGVLDEAANVCRWRHLPDLYSHYGSRGICLLTLLQSWSQGEEAWGATGMRKLWSAATVRVYGGGVAEPGFLRMLSELAGERTAAQFQVGHLSQPGTAGARTVTRNEVRLPLLDVAELAALPPGQVLVLPSGSRPVLARAVPWWEGPHAEDVRESLAAGAGGTR
ncbi:type IV secretory system conjugative DNA transfer family protein [Kitasatospora sp. NPDC058965]|uniref:type IV secretory system conjugative DNA transfer family protein n=1 Tax=Kitasatospora sp. NPDC058965 TaxID=3346682 RepID=UPI0036BBA444